jgi:hypothetical protein
VQQLALLGQDEEEVARRVEVEVDASRPQDDL